MAMEIVDNFMSKMAEDKKYGVREKRKSAINPEFIKRREENRLFSSAIAVLERREQGRVKETK